jgi:hypothetical protein
VGTEIINTYFMVLLQKSRFRWFTS